MFNDTIYIYKDYVVENKLESLLIARHKDSSVIPAILYHAESQDGQNWDIFRHDSYVRHKHSGDYKDIIAKLIELNDPLYNHNPATWAANIITIYEYHDFVVEKFPDDSIRIRKHGNDRIKAINVFNSYWDIRFDGVHLGGVSLNCSLCGNNYDYIINRMAAILV